MPAADDNRDDLDMLCDALEKEGYGIPDKVRTLRDLVICIESQRSPRGARKPRRSDADLDDDDLLGREMRDGLTLSRGGFGSN